MKKNKLHTIFKASECITEYILIKYVNKELSNLQQNIVEQHSINCELCSDAIEGFEENKNSIASFLKLKKSYHKKTSSLIYYISAIAASILIFLIIDNTSEVRETNNNVAELRVYNSNDSLTSFSRKKTFNADENILQDNKTEQINVEKKRQNENSSDIIHNDNSNIAKARTNSKNEEKPIVENFDEEEISTDDNITENKIQDLNLKFTPSKEKNELQSDYHKAISEENETDAKEPEIILQNDQRIIGNSTQKNKLINSRIIEESKVEAYFETGKKAYEIKDWKLAIQKLLKVKKETIKEYYEANYLIGESYLKLKKKRLAKKHFKISNHLDSNWKIKSDIELNKLK